MRNNKIVHTIAQSALIAAVYATLTLALPLQHMEVQFRVAEILVLLCFYNKKYIPALIVGCFIANIPMGLVDMVFGTFATAVSVVLMTRVKNIWVAAMFPVIINAVIIGAMLKYMFGVPLPLSYK